MTENDYIAEYIKERHPGVLGLDFAMWKMSKKFSEIGKELVEIFQSIDFQQILAERQESEDKE